MAKAVLQSNIQASDGGLTVAAGATVTIRNSDTLALATLYTDRAGGTTKANPVTADADGFFIAYVDVGRYNIAATYSGDTQTFNDVVAADGSIEVDNLINSTDNNQRIDASGGTESQNLILGSSGLNNYSNLTLETDNGTFVLGKNGSSSARDEDAVIWNNDPADIVFLTAQSVPVEKARINHAGGITVETDAPATPTANTLYADSMVKAWGRIEYSGSTPSLVDDFNISGITDSGVGLTELTFATAMANADYSCVASSNEAYVNGPRVATVTSVGTTQTTVSVSDMSSTYTDSAMMAVVIGAQ